MVYDKAMIDLFINDRLMVIIVYSIENLKYI